MPSIWLTHILAPHLALHGRGCRFQHVSGVLSRMVDLDSVISSCIQLPKMETVGTASSRIQVRVGDESCTDESYP